MRASVLKRYPELTEEDVIFQQVDDVVFLHVWNSGKPKPTMEQIKAWVEEDSFINAKQNKINELNQSCNEAILAGFFHTVDGVEYHFSFDVEAQLNFQGSRALLNEGIVPAIEWTVTVNGVYERILVDKVIMDELTLKILQHKDSNIRKLRNELMPLVEAAAIKASKSELELIVW